MKRLDERHDVGKAAVARLRIAELDAAIFDLDGVVTRTAEVHAAAWKRLFDDFLRARSAATGEPFRPFEIDTDYPDTVDGKPRFNGVESFLRSRGISLPWGRNDDPEDAETIHGLGNRKNRYFNEHLSRNGVGVFESTVDVLRALRAAGVKTALASSSRNAKAVIDAAGLADLFDAHVDGNDLAQAGLKGKPDPDLFLLAAERLHASPARTVVFEDAVSGVQAGYSGGFRHVIGIDRHGAPQTLRDGGADIVVTDLAFLKLEGRGAGKGQVRAIE